jgi:predicted DCC family thiol-disulfide oxidoreductase YuxK
MRLFINYFSDVERQSPFNIAIARVLLGTYLLWKFTTQVNWSRLTEWPVFIVEFHRHLLPYDALRPIVVVEQAILVIILVLFIIGYRIAITGFLSALIVAHASGVLYMMTNSGTSSTFLPPVFFLLFFALYRHQDKLSVDSFRQYANEDLQSLNERLTAQNPGPFRADTLKWTLFITALIYWFTGWGKVQQDVIEWMTAESMMRHVMRAKFVTGRPLPWGDIMLDYPLLARITGVTTVVAELGFVFAVIFGLSITTFVFVFLGMHTGIALMLTPYFFDQYLLFLVFVPWDRVYSRIVPKKDLDVVYDGNCHFCIRSLLFFKWLDINNDLQFHSQHALDERFEDRVSDYDEAMYVFAGDSQYRGYHAFRKLLSHFRIFAPIVYILETSFVKQWGERVYAYVARNRNQIFTCSVPNDD